MRRLNRIAISKCVLALACLGVVCEWIDHSATAAPLVGYKLRMSSDPRLLAAPNDPTVRMLVSKKTKYDLMIDRMMPYFELQNTSDEESLESWQFSVGQTDYNFQNLEVLEMSSGSGGAASAQSMLPLGTASADLLAMNFSGLTPGQSVVGRITLGADNQSIMQVPDFRSVLFQMDSTEAPEVTQNAVIQTSFSDGSVLEGILPNFTHDEAALGMALIPCSNESFFEQEVFEFEQQGDAIVPTEPMEPEDPMEPMEPELPEVVPEPGSMMLLAIGMACLFGGWLIRRGS